MQSKMKRWLVPSLILLSTATAFSANKENSCITPFLGNTSMSQMPSRGLSERLDHVTKLEMTIDELTPEALELFQMVRRLPEGSHNRLQSAEDNLIKKKLFGLFGKTEAEQRATLKDPRALLAAYEKSTAPKDRSRIYGYYATLQWTTEFLKWARNHCADMECEVLVTKWITDHVLASPWQVSDRESEYKEYYIQLFSKIFQNRKVSGVYIRPYLVDGGHGAVHGKRQAFSFATEQVAKLYDTSSLTRIGRDGRSLFTWQLGNTRGTDRRSADAERNKLRKNLFTYNWYTPAVDQPLLDNRTLEALVHFELTGDSSLLVEEVNWLEKMKRESGEKFDHNSIHDWAFQMVKNAYTLSYDYIKSYITQIQTPENLKKIKESNPSLQDLLLYITDAPRAYEAKAALAPALSREELVGFKPAITYNSTVKELDKKQLEITTTQKWALQDIKTRQEALHRVFERANTFSTMVVESGGMINVEYAKKELRDIQKLLQEYSAGFSYWIVFLSDFRLKSLALAQSSAEKMKKESQDSVRDKLEQLQTLVSENAVNISGQVQGLEIELNSISIYEQWVSELIEIAPLLNPQAVLRATQEFAQERAVHGK